MGKVILNSSVLFTLLSNCNQLFAGKMFICNATQMTLLRYIKCTAYYEIPGTFDRMMLDDSQNINLFHAVHAVILLVRFESVSRQR
jgi:hypothetical protein